MKYIDISVLHFNSQYTRRAHEFGVNTQILLKVPVENLTTVRLKSEDPANIVKFLAAEGWDDAKIAMHLNALKTLTTDREAPHHKNRWISEHRAQAIA